MKKYLITYGDEPRKTVKVVAIDAEHAREAIRKTMIGVNIVSTNLIK